MILLRLFFLLLYVNLFTIGGGYVMIPILEHEIVSHYGWLTQKEFIDSIAIGQITPGPLTIMNTFIGYKIAGIWGSVVALVGSYLPSMIVGTLASKYYIQYKSSPIVAACFRGIKPAVIGLLAAVAIKLGGGSVVDSSGALIALSSFGLIAFTKIDPTFVILGAGLIGLIL